MQEVETTEMQKKVQCRSTIKNMEFDRVDNLEAM